MPDTSCCPVFLRRPGSRCWRWPCWARRAAASAATGKAFKNENDDLRAENLKLAREIDAFEDRVRLLDSELSTLRKDRQGDAPLPDAIPPVLSALKFARYTGPIDTDDDGADDRVVMYIQPVDQLGRMRVTAGRLNVQAVSLRAATPPRVVADRTYEPREFDDRWRTGLTGDHYSIDLDLPAIWPPTCSR